jgi:molybdopterin-containing oxidoreductase family iron-sulfur binding subunit
MSLDQRDEVRAARRRDFAAQAAGLTDPVSRRDFLRLMGGSLALAGLTACSGPPREKIVPYTRAPEELIPGKPLFYATVLPIGGYASGVLVESHEGRPTKIEGNPQHPASLGATDALTQAAVLGLYDPERSRTITNQGRPSTWPQFLTTLHRALENQRLSQGAGLRLLTETVSSPTLTSQLRELLGRFPAARWHQYEPLSRDNARAGARLAFGQDLETIYRFEAADVVLSLDADPLGSGPGQLRYARDFAARRRVGPGQPPLNRLYAVESTPSITGSLADQRLVVPARAVESVARAVATGLGAPVGTAPTGAPQIPADWLAALIADLQQHRGASLVLAGEWQSPIVHALAHTLNQTLGNVGRTLYYTDPVVAEPANQTASLRDLAADLAAGRVELLTIVGGNPVFTAPADLAFGEQLQRAGLRIRLGLYEDETSALCQWHLSETHPLEAWGDARAYDGTVSIVQPLIAPLYQSHSAHDLLAAFSDQPERSGHDLVRSYWQAQHPSPDFEQFWRNALHDGLIAGTALPAKTVALQGELASGPATPSPPANTLELTFRPDPTIHDGRFASNGWLQELPKPLTSLTWDNVAIVSPPTAAQLGLQSEDLVELQLGDAIVQAPIWVQAGQADESVTVQLGYGRTRGAGPGSGAGFNAYALRTSDGLWIASGLELHKTDERYRLATTQGHHQMEGREIVRAVNLAEYQRHPALAQDANAIGGSLYPPYPDEGYAWGMAIDLSTCIGCGACVVGCQAENNIPVVGKAEVLHGREMHWLRVDSYQAAEPADPRTYHQPVPCMHCETAPCELVCPVGATVHSGEGLNEMVYNRCVGTRYCSNNCPYKVRRFNFFEFADFTTESLKPLRNPDVTVRSRGVMEKCTYCVQRINAARIQAEKDGRPVRDGEVVTACQAACPTEAIVFGNLNDPTSRVAQLNADPRNYALLGELGTRPRTTYLAAVRNPNPGLAESV